jgi:hypothetical protein
MKTSNPRELVNLLNEKFYEICLDEQSAFSYSTDGNTEIIYFYEWPLWSSECDGYASEDDNEYLTDVVYKLFVEHVSRINSADPRVLFFNY